MSNDKKLEEKQLTETIESEEDFDDDFFDDEKIRKPKGKKIKKMRSFYDR